MPQAFQNVHVLSPNFAFHRRQDQAFRSKNKNVNKFLEFLNEIFNQRLFYHLICEARAGK